MISPGRSGALNSFAENFAQEIALQVARAVEIDRLDLVGKSLPHDMMTNRLRPALRRVNGSERTPTPLRFFCMPFEDLLGNASERAAKKKGRISRSSVAPIWSWIGRILLPLETATYRRNFKTAIAAGDQVTGKAHAANFWALAAKAMRGALASEGGRSRACRTLCDDLVLADAEEIALLLGVAPAIMSIQETVLRPTHKLTDEQLRMLRAIHDTLSKAEPDAAPYVALIAMNRLAHHF